MSGSFSRCESVELNLVVPSQRNGYKGWARLGSKKEQSFLLIYKAWSADITNQQPWAVDTRPWSH
ncbi:uncharacterized protein PHALS_03078 [Plasmopara halstedii]|uniref:Uncharacterized protein n=1 Tax=Plasmopara halstedii TaxID=4781 RepID=A0A0P1A7P3_PLAHL|nr:uncharacterized protein PHALS_03078 [Plasmopara halstedii]CEG36530.1 hypothetical protein PHALS_03078 [Plasmopara halstedii]|eukprot:XP_024572899.1 hypothetical protein PHALS_03078 [Plasmopara halstedii]